MKRLIIIAIILSFLLPNVALAQDFDRMGMLESLVENVIVPKHETFVTDAATLEAALQALDAEPSAVNLLAAQEAWRIAWASWAETVVFSSRRLQIVQNQVSKPPANTEFIDDFILDEENILDADFIAGVGSTSKGLPAIEYFIFDPQGDAQTILAALQDNPRRMAYLIALGESLLDNAEEILVMWQGTSAEDFVGADQAGTVLRSSISMVTNDMAALTEGIAQMKIGLPLGTRFDNDPDPDPTEAEAFRSRASTIQIIHNLIGLRDAFTGAEEIGFDDYLDFLAAEYNGEQLSDAIIAQIDATITSLQALEQPLAIAVVESPDTVLAIQNEVTQLLILLRVDMANQLGVTITFNDNDGD